MANLLMEVKAGKHSMTLYQFPSTVEEWIKTWSYTYMETHRHSTPLEREELYRKYLKRHLKWQGTLIKNFMRNCNGHKGR